MKKLVLNVKCQKVKMFNLLDFSGTALNDDKICVSDLCVIIFN